MKKTEQIFTTDSSIKTQQIGEEFGKSLKGGEVIALFGELGSGKTTFVQGLAKGLGITRRILSPTFVLVREHRIKNGELGIMNLYHIDLYRIENSKDFRSLGLEEILNDKSAIVAIEWAEKMGNLLPEKRVDIYFEYLGEDKRKIRIHSS